MGWKEVGRRKCSRGAIYAGQSSAPRFVSVCPVVLVRTEEREGGFHSSLSTAAASSSSLLLPSGEGNNGAFSLLRHGSSSRPPLLTWTYGTAAAHGVGFGLCQAPSATQRTKPAYTERSGAAAVPASARPSDEVVRLSPTILYSRRGGSRHREPTWLQAAIADIEQRVRALAAGVPGDDGAAADHSFAERAENYYHRRPQLLALLTDLHHRYLYLADRYAQSLLSNAKSSAHSHHLNLNLNLNSDCSSDVDDRFSDAGSSLSFQPHTGITNDHHRPSPAPAVDCDLVVAELVMAWVDRDVLADEAERRGAETARKIELQGSLLEVLESERLVLLGENARLAFRAEEEAAAAAAELGYTRRRAADLARLAVKLRDDHRACMLGRKVEALQAQVYGLELRNRECFQAMAAWDAERKAGVAEIERLRAENRRLAAEAKAAQASARRTRGGKGGSGWWWLARVRLAAEWTPCAPTSVTVRKVGEQIKGGKYNGGCFCL